MAFGFVAVVVGWVCSRHYRADQNLLFDVSWVYSRHLRVDLSLLVDVGCLDPQRSGLDVSGSSLMLWCPDFVEEKVCAVVKTFYDCGAWMDSRNFEIARARRMYHHGLLRPSSPCCECSAACALCWTREGMQEACI
jgi:hypothetical protein